MKEQTSVLPLFWVVYIPLIRAAQGETFVGINWRCRNARAVYAKPSAEPPPPKKKKTSYPSL